MKNYDCVIIGGGPGGSTLALELLNAGWKVALVEKESFPRFRIGESLLPYSMPVFRKNGFLERLDGGKYIRKYGAQFIDYRHDREIYFRFDGDDASASEPFAFEVPRALFDSDLLEYVKEKGVEVLQPETVQHVAFEDNQVRVRTDQQELITPYVADATGRMSFLGQQLKLKKTNADLNNVAVFAHFEGVTRRPGQEEGDIVIGVLPDQSWSWTIPFKGRLTSVGIVSSRDRLDPQTLRENFIETKLVECPLYRERMQNATRATEVG